MTAVEVLFRYGMPPGEMEMGALGQVSDVYGIRRVRFNEPDRTIRVEYDATRLNESTVEKLLRSAGFDIREKLALGVTRRRCPIKLPTIQKAKCRMGGTSPFCLAWSSNASVDSSLRLSRRSRRSGGGPNLERAAQ